LAENTFNILKKRNKFYNFYWWMFIPT